MNLRKLAEVPHDIDDVRSGVQAAPRVYDSIPDDATTASSDIVSEYAKLSNWKAVPRLAYEGDIGLLPLDPTMAFVLSQIDGIASIEAIVDGSPFGEEGTLYVLAQLVAMRVISLTDE